MRGREIPERFGFPESTHVACAERLIAILGSGGPRITSPARAAEPPANPRGAQS